MKLKLLLNSGNHNQNKLKPKQNMLRVLAFLFATCFFMPAMSVSAKNAQSIVSIKNGKLVGKTRMTYLYWNIYDAYLYSNTGKWQVGKPFTLKLTYLRNFKGKDIAKRSVKEIKKQGMTNQKKLAKWGKLMQSIFPNVRKGSSLVGVVDQNKHTTFYYQGKNVGKVTDPEFTTWFFNIWLGKNTSEPKLRRQLLGQVK